MGGNWWPPRCFYSISCQTRPSVATHRTTGCSANTPTYAFCELLGSVYIGAVKRTVHYFHGTPNLYITFSRNNKFELAGFFNTLHYTGNPKRRGLHQETCTSSLGGHPLQHPHRLQQPGGFTSSRAGYLQQSKTSRSGFWVCATVSSIRSSSSARSRQGPA